MLTLSFPSSTLEVLSCGLVWSINRSWMFICAQSMTQRDKSKWVCLVCIISDKYWQKICVNTLVSMKITHSDLNQHDTSDSNAMPESLVLTTLIEKHIDIDHVTRVLLTQGWLEDTQIPRSLAYTQNKTLAHIIQYLIQQCCSILAHLHAVRS